MEDNWTYFVYIQLVCHKEPLHFSRCATESPSLFVLEKRLILNEDMEVCIWQAQHLAADRIFLSSSSRSAYFSRISYVLKPS